MPLVRSGTALAAATLVALSLFACAGAPAGGAPVGGAPAGGASAGGASAEAAPAGPHPEAPPQTAELAFLVGDWNLDAWFLQPDGSRRRSEAIQRTGWTLDGFGLRTEARWPREGRSDFVSTRTLVYHPKLERWIGSGINNLGNRKDWSGELVDGRLSLDQTGMQFSGGDEIRRLVLERTGPDSYRARQDVSEDGGATWTEGVFGFEATRM